MRIESNPPDNQTFTGPSAKRTRASSSVFSPRSDKTRRNSPSLPYFHRFSRRAEVFVQPRPIAWGPMNLRPSPTPSTRMSGNRTVEPLLIFRLRIETAPHQQYAAQPFSGDPL